MTAEACLRFCEELAALRQGEEAGIPTAELRDHLQSCAQCRLAEEQATAVSELLQSCQPPLPAGGYDRLSAAVAVLAERSRREAPP